MGFAHSRILTPRGMAYHHYLNCFECGQELHVGDEYFLVHIKVPYSQQPRRYALITSYRKRVPICKLCVEKKFVDADEKMSNISTLTRRDLVGFP